MVLAAVGQICSTSSMSHNLAQCQTLIKGAAEAGAKALFLPEASDYMSSTSKEAVDLAQPVSTSPFVLGLQDAAKTHKIFIQVSLHEPTTPPSSRILNTLLWISDTGALLPDTRYAKLHMFDVDLSDTGGPKIRESDTTEPGTRIVPPFTGSPLGASVGSQICFDVRFPEPALQLRRLGAQVLVYPSAFTVPTGQIGHWEVLLRARAIETECYVVAAAQCGRHNAKRVSYGGSMVVDPKGRVVTRASRVEGRAEDEREGVREPELLVFDFDEALVRDARRTIPLERRWDVYPKI